MKLVSLTASRYRSLREETISLNNLNLFIGTNASGKSSILDALHFLNEGVQERDFSQSVFSRGGIIHLAWKGEEAQEIRLVVRFEDDGRTYEWSVRLRRLGYDFSVQENVTERRPPDPPTQLLWSDGRTGEWYSGDRGEQVSLVQNPTACALAAASADASFPARKIAEFVGRWGFFDPNPFLLRRDWSGFDRSKFDPYGRNLAGRLDAIQKNSPDIFEQIVDATQSVLGLPTQIEIRESEDRDRPHFVQHEPGLAFSVHQIGASSGTLRMLALMTAVFGESESNLIGIEEPENHIHPTALASFAEYLLRAKDNIQILVTTHSPLLLDFLNEPEAVRVVRNITDEGTRVVREIDGNAVRIALEASGFGLGEFYETKGFGS